MSRDFSPDRQKAGSIDIVLPRVIPPDKHPIRAQDIDREALKVLFRLRDAGHTAYLVGGGVRDLYLGKTPKDFDISTDARPGQLRKIFGNSRIIGRRFRLVQVFFRGGKIVEVATFRCRNEEEPEGDATLADNNTFGNPEEDAFRRDLTINSLFFDVDSGSIIDYTGGVDDLDQGIIRLVGDPERRVLRDPVRSMRVIRHAARGGFRIEAGTWAAVCGHTDLLALCPVSRIRDELFKDLQGGALGPWFTLALESGIFLRLLPFYADVLAEEKNRQLLRKLLDVCDRLLAHGTEIPDPVLLAALLWPWAETVHKVSAQPPERAALHHFFYFLRGELDSILTPINIPRATRETMATILSLQALFDTDDREGNTRALAKKSFFNSCLLLTGIRREALGEAVATPVPAATKKAAAPDRSSMRPDHPASRREYRPLFVPSLPGGIFGLKSGRPKK